MQSDFYHRPLGLPYAASYSVGGFLRCVAALEIARALFVFNGDAKVT
ncbi:MAG: hypothetical protein ABJA98_22020 [Acidobacteriota bacterium]